MMKLKLAKGFSIIELLIVIAIIAIVGVIAIPSFTKYQNNNDLRNAAQEIYADMQIYKKRAVAEHTRYILQYLELTPGKITCRVWKLPAPTGFSGIAMISTKNILENNSAISMVTSPPPHFNNGSDLGWGYAWVVLDRRGTMGEGSITFSHTRTNSTVTISTSFLGRIWVTYKMK